jgi:hypothetical protein
MGTLMSTTHKSRKISPGRVKEGDVILVKDVSSARVLVRRLHPGKPPTGRPVQVVLLEGPRQGAIIELHIPWSAAVLRFDTAF